MFDHLLDSSLYNTAAALTAVFALLDHTRISRSALTARKHATGPMENLTNTLIISPSFLSCKLCQQMLHMQRRCAIEQSMCTNLALSRMFSMDHIIRLCSRLLFLLVRATHSSTSRMNVTLSSAFQQTVLVPSRSTNRHVGPSFFSTTTSLLNSASERSIAFTLPQFRVPKSLGIGIHFVGRSFKNLFS